MAVRTVVPLRKRQHSRREPFFYSGFRLAECGLTPVGKPTREQWEECVTYVTHIHRNAQWWIGDILLYGNARWGAMYDEMLKNTPYEPRTLRTFKWVASRFDISRRRALPFAYHQEVAGLPPLLQDAVLDRCEHEGWTSERIRHEVNRLTYETQRPAGRPPVGLHHGDARIILAQFANESCDLLLTDPPQERVDDLAEFREVLGLAVAKLKPNSHAYIFTTRYRYTHVLDIVEQHLEMHNTLAWVMNDEVVSSDDDPTNYVDQYRLILFAHKGRRHLNGRRDGDVSVQFDEQPLLQYFIQKSTQRDEVVLDPFMNTGATGVAATALGRHYVGIEQDSGRYKRVCLSLASSTSA